MKPPTFQAIPYELFGRAIQILTGHSYASKFCQRLVMPYAPSYESQYSPRTTPMSLSQPGSKPY